MDISFATWGQLALVGGLRLPLLCVCRGPGGGFTLFQISLRCFNSDIPGITQTAFTGPLHRELDESGNEMIRSRNAVIVSPGRVDRSPCGTGTSARLALLHARGEIEAGQLFRHESLIGSTFDSRVEETTTVGDYPAVIPSVAGRCWITSFNQLVLDPSDPLPHGYTPSDTWMKID